MRHAEGAIRTVVTPMAIFRAELIFEAVPLFADFPWTISSRVKRVDWCKTSGRCRKARWPDARAVVGAEISAESAKTLLSGGIEFGTPNEPEAAVTNGAVFRLYDKPEDAWKNWAPAIRLNLPAQAPEGAAALPPPQLKVQ